MAEIKACAIYCRVSTDAQRERHTIDSQRTLLPQLAEKHGLAVYKEYIDDGISGESIEARPAFQQLLDDSSTGNFQAVLVIDFDRLTRATDLTQLALIKKIFRDNSVTVITPSQVFDFHDHDHDFLSDLFGILAKHEKRKILARTRRGIKEKQRQGKWIMGRVPTPYYRAVKGGPVIIDPVKKALVLEILDEAKSKGRTQISHKFALGQGMLKRMLSRFRLLFYAGYLELDGELVRGSWEPIIDLKDAEALLAHTEARKDRTEFTKASYLLTGMGIFTCAECGKAIGSHTDSATRKPLTGSRKTAVQRHYRRGYYRCNNRRCELRPRVNSAEVLEQHILRRLDSHLSHLEIIHGFMEHIEARSKKATQISIIENRIKAEETKKKNLVRAISAGAIGIDDAGEEMNDVRAKLQSLKAELSSLCQNDSSFTPEQLQALSGILPSELSLGEARATIKACIEKMVLHRSNLWIFYRFPLNEKGENGERIKLVR